ncbi:DUF4956 domain-containing protein [Candidatus Pelagibacter sp.]|nr:DUF4956 domain-containing protein [Candidatus Pelagibacter sp.]
MEAITINDLKNFEIDISLFSLLISLLTSIICAYIIKIIYLKYAKTLNNKENFSDVFILLSVTTTIVITVVKFSLALSLGLVGALSIVRFRAAIKEPEELVYLFMIIGIGLASGSSQYEVAFVLTGAVFIIIFASNRFSKKNITFNSEILNIDINENDYESFNEKLKSISKINNIEIELKSLNKQDQKFYIVYIIKNLYMADKAEIFIKELKDIKNVNFALSKDIHLPI